MARRERRSGNDAAAPSWSVKEIVELAAQHNLAELEVESAGTRIRVVREHAPARATSAPAAFPEALAERRAAPDTTAAVHLVTVDAPMVGTFYRAASPGSAPFVSEGDLVKEGQALCIIEAMKLMNEIEAKVGGRIAKILVENGQPVEYGQPLFSLEPLR
jgi:acetyl-CoA carboxylase biotin carboxyl carrier protein